MDKDVTSKLKALSDISSIDITLEFDSILQNILRITCMEIKAHSGTIMLVDESNNELRMVASYGLPDNYIERVYEAARRKGVPISSSPSGIVLETGKYYTVPDISKEPRNRPWLHLSKEIGFSSQIFTPMKRGSAVMGLLNAYMAEPHQFTEDEINFVTIAASQATSVVQNARICTRLKNNVEELKGYKERLEDIIKDTHKRLYDSEKYLRSIIETSIDGIAVVDDKGKIEFGNDSFFTIIGWPREEIIGHSFIKMLSDDTKELYLKIWSNAQDIRPDTGNQAEAKIKTKSGEIGFLHVSRVQTYIEGKKKFVFIAKDITEKRRLEQELIESEARYKDLFENADDPMFTLDTENCFVELNRAGLKALGCSNEEIIGTHISKWLTPESFEIAQKAIRKRMLNEPIEPPTILEIKSKNRKRRWIEIRSRILKNGDMITGIHGIARDITEKRIMETKIKEYHKKLSKSYEELKVADKLKTEFISNITHELLTPLTSIKGFAELLDDGTMGSINKEQKRSLEIILRNSDRLTRLIKELLDSAHLEKNKLGLEFRLVSMNRIILKSIQDMHPHAKNKHITINQEIQPLQRIWGDEERLTQVITNLLFNAIKFTPQKGTITVTAGEGTNQIEISITDTGIGIPADKLSRVFDRFYQVDGSSSRKYGGVGLGLSICKSIVEKHSGSIWAESKGIGSTFHIMLPKLTGKKRGGKNIDT